jgi:hypothetical protein
MTFGNPAKSFVELAAIVGQFNELATLLDPKNGDKRWNRLQRWLEDNPDKKYIVERTASLPTAEALPYLLETIGIDMQLLRPFDTKGEIQAKAEQAIAQLQQLYNERKRMKTDKKLPERKNIHSDGKQ